MESELPRTRWVALIAVAATVILAPQFSRLITLPHVQLTENRTLAQLPQLPSDFLSLHTFPQKLNDYLQDQFPLRGEAIQTVSYLRYRAGYSALSKVVVGKDGWLFYDNGAHMEQGRGILTYAPEVLADWMFGLEQRLEYVKQRGENFYVLPAPMQETIYPEKLPDWLAKDVKPTTDVDQILAAAKAKGIDQIVDVRPALVAAKAARAVYGPYDVHWNGDGAYIAYRTLMERISRDYPDLAPLPQSSFTPNPETEQKGLALMLGIANFIDDDRKYYGNAPLHDFDKITYLSDRRDLSSPQILATNPAATRTLLFIRDSFASEFIPFLKPHFRRIIVVHADDGDFRKDLIERFHPDIVILESISDSLRFRMKLLQ
jgi:alginate O-acetyltransferase complex protein AlgJ